MQVISLKQDGLALIPVWSRVLYTKELSIPAISSSCETEIKNYITCISSHENFVTWWVASEGRTLYDGLGTGIVLKTGELRSSACLSCNVFQRFPSFYFPRSINILKQFFASINYQSEFFLECLYVVSCKYINRRVCSCCPFFVWYSFTLFVFIANYCYIKALPPSNILHDAL